MEGCERAVFGDTAEKVEENLDVLTEAQDKKTLPIMDAQLKEGRTTPPKHYTEDTLLAAMETAGKEDMPEEAERRGIGTPATRAATIEKLVQKEFSGPGGWRQGQSISSLPRRVVPSLRPCPSSSNPRP